jgi:hypothetical protein
VEPEEMVLARQWHGEHISTAKDMYSNRRTVEITVCYAVLPKAILKYQWDNYQS